MGGSEGDSGGSHSPAAQLLGSTQHGGQVAQVYLHGGDLRGGVLLQHQVPRGLRLLGVAAGEAQVDASILPQQPPAQSEPHAAATARWSASSAGGALPPSPHPETSIPTRSPAGSRHQHHALHPGPDSAPGAPATAALYPLPALSSCLRHRPASLLGQWARAEGAWPRGRWRDGGARGGAAGVGVAC